MAMLRVQTALEQTLKQGLLDLFKVQASDLSLQETKKEFEGEFTLVVFPFTKAAQCPPPQLAQSLGDYLLRSSDLVESIQVVQGFLNIALKPKVWIAQFEAQFKAESLNLSPGSERILIEYSSPNTNKPLHLGHLRNNFLGYSVAKLLEAAGHTVIKTNLVNDRGIHICKSMLAYQRFGQGESPESAGIKGDHLVGKYYVIFDQAYKEEIQALMAAGKTEAEAKAQAPLMQAAQAMLLAWEQGEAEVVDLWKRMNAWVFKGFEESYAQMGVEFDQIYKESETYLLGKSLVQEGLDQGVFFKKDDGSVWIDLSDVGLDEKLVLRKDGTSVYITQDMGTAQLKYQDHQAQRSIYVVGNEQDYHFEVLFHILRKLNKPFSEGNYHLSYGMVDLPSGKMKSREGTVVDADDLMAEMRETAKTRTLELGKIEGFSKDEQEALFHQLGMGALKYFLLKVEPKKRMLFNPEESIDFQGNTGPFIQYTHARICSIERKAASEGIRVPTTLPAVALEKTSLELLVQLCQYPEIIQSAAAQYAPSVMANYVYDLAKQFNKFYNELSILNEPDADKKSIRLALAVQSRKTIQHACSLLGIVAPQRM